LNIKEWLDTSGEPVEESAWVDPPKLPYILYFDSVQRGGGDLKNIYKHHSLSIERYSQTNDTNIKLEELFDKKALKYTKQPPIYLSDEQMFMTIYDNIEFFER